DQPHLAVACDAATAPGLPALLRTVARLVVAGLPLRLERLTAGRSQRLLDLDHLPIGALAEPATPSTWVVNGSRARPPHGPEPCPLGAGTLPGEATQEGEAPGDPIPNGRATTTAARQGSDGASPSRDGASPSGERAGALPADVPVRGNDYGTRDPH